jgi:hypothetical protein
MIIYFVLFSYFFADPILCMPSEDYSPFANEGTGTISQGAVQESCQGYETRQETKRTYINIQPKPNSSEVMEISETDLKLQKLDEVFNHKCDRLDRAAEGYRY